MKTLIVGFFVLVLFGMIFDALSTLGKFYDNTIAPAVVDVVEILTPYNWDEPEPSPENYAKEYLLKVGPKAVYGWGSKIIDGVPVVYEWYPESRYVIEPNRPRIISVNNLEEVQKKKSPIYFFKFRGIDTKLNSSSNKVVVMSAYVQKLKDDHQVPFDGRASLMDFRISIEFETNASAEWKPILIRVLNNKGQVTSPWELINKNPTPEEISDIYMNHNAISKKVYQGVFKYDTPSARLDHVLSNARYY